MSTGAIKKFKYNSFSHFMFDYKKKEEAKGRKMDMTVATMEAGEIWKVI